MWKFIQFVRMKIFILMKYLVFWGGRIIKVHFYGIIDGDDNDVLSFINFEIKCAKLFEVFIIFKYAIILIKLY